MLILSCDYQNFFLLFMGLCFVCDCAKYTSDVKLFIYSVVCTVLLAENISKKQQKISEKNTICCMLYLFTVSKIAVLFCL